MNDCMAGSRQTKRFCFWRWLIAFIGVTVPRPFRTRFRREWEAELEYREDCWSSGTGSIGETNFL
jgi:hypothetical protein